MKYLLVALNEISDGYLILIALGAFIQLNTIATMEMIRHSIERPGCCKIMGIDPSKYLLPK